MFVVRSYCVSLLQRRMSFLKTFVTVVFFLLSGEINAQNDEFRSPCPGFFAYEFRRNERDTWYGTLTLFSETDISGVQLRLMLDRTSLELGNSFGEVETTDNRIYSIVNQQFQLRANAHHIVEFYIKYNPNERVPKLSSFMLNSRTVCPGGPTTVTQLGNTPLFTSRAPEGGPVNDDDDDDDDFNVGDFDVQTIPPNAIPPDMLDINSICGTVVTKNRTKREPHRYYDSYPNYQHNIDSLYRYWNGYPNHENQFHEASSNGEYFHDHVHHRPSITYIPPVQEPEFPWHAVLYYHQNLKNFVYLCGASLISQSHVITPAHCVTQSGTQKLLPIQNLAVYLGLYYLKRVGDKDLQRRTLSQIIPHPLYDPETFGNDIAVVQFKTPMRITDFVRPVCLWQDFPDLNSIVDKQGNVVGMDFSETGSPRKEPVRAKMLVKSPDTCFAFGDTYCARYTSGTPKCIAGSGSGMVFPKSNSDRQNPRWQLRGFISVNGASQNRFKCSISDDVVFTDVAQYIDWIVKSTQCPRTSNDGICYSLNSTFLFH